MRNKTSKFKYMRGRIESAKRQFCKEIISRGLPEIMDNHNTYQRWYGDDFFKLSSKQKTEFKGQVCIKCCSTKVSYVFRTYYYYFEDGSYYIARKGGRIDCNGEIVPFLCDKCFRKLHWIPQDNYSLIGKPLPVDEPCYLGGTCQD